MPSTGAVTPVGSAMFISSDTRAFRSRTITISSSFADMRSEMPCEQTWSIAPRIGVGVLCGDGVSSRNPIQTFCRCGRFHDYRTGWNESTNHSRSRNWTRFVSPRIEAVHWATKRGWNRSPDGSILNPPSVPEGGQVSVSLTTNQSKRPDPFDVLVTWSRET